MMSYDITVWSHDPHAPRVLVTMMKHVTVGEVKDALLAVVGRAGLSHELVILAEVKGRSVSRVLVSLLNILLEKWPP